MLIVNLGCEVIVVVLNLIEISVFFFVVDGIGGYVFVDIYVEY